MTDKTIHLILPGVVPEDQTEITPHYPHLSKILSRATAFRHSAYSLETHLTYLFGLKDQALPTGALGAYYHGLIDQDHPDQWFCRADPVEVQADAHTAFMKSTLYSALNQQDQQAVKSILESLLTPEVRLYQTPKEWYFALSKAQDLVTNPIWEVLGKSLHLRLPSGPDANYFKRLMTEIQMMFSDHAFNQERVGKNKTLDSLWFWGFGKCPEQVICDFDLILSNEPSVGGLAKCAGVPFELLTDKVMPLPENFRKMLIVDTRLLQTLRQAGVEAWMNALSEYEAQWFEMILSSIQNQTLKKLILNLGKNALYILTKWQLNFFWRRVKPFNRISTVQQLS